MDIPIAEALVLWNSALNGGVPAFAVRPLGHDDYYEFDFQVGACFAAWREMDTHGQKFKLLIDVWHVVGFYCVPIVLVLPELLRIPEYRDMLADDCLPKQFRSERF
jgi:hypothetical protein